MERPSEELLRQAAKLANERARRELLPSDAPPAFKHEWNPFDQETVWFGFSLRMPDKYVNRILADPPLAYRANQIANESILTVLTAGKEKPVKPFLEDILQTLMGR